MGFSINIGELPNLNSRQLRQLNSWTLHASSPKSLLPQIIAEEEQTIHGHLHVHYCKNLTSF